MQTLKEAVVETVVVVDVEKEPVADGAALVRLVAREALLPEIELKLSEWAATYRKLPSKTSSEPGPWRNERTPYLVEPMESMSTYRSTLSSLKRTTTAFRPPKNQALRMMSLMLLRLLRRLFAHKPS